MKKNYVFFFLHLFFFSNSSIAQSQFQNLTSSVSQFSEKYPWEKVYLHTDKPHYSLNDTIWIKAYALMESDENQTEISPSVPLYVELFMAGKKDPVEQIIINVFDNKGFGDIVIPRNIGEGFYTLRAYTNWMRNFGEDVFFHKDIWIGDIKDAGLSPMAGPSGSKVDFFPEGGDLVAGLESKVAFKAVDGFGKGDDVIGYLLNSKKDTLFRFESEYLGMGKFTLIPRNGEKYTAWIKMAGMDWHMVPLPEVKEIGLVMRILEEDDEHLRIGIQHNYPKDIKIHILGLFQDQTVFNHLKETNNHSAIISVPKDDFDPGLVQFTVFDESWKPLAERLVYMHQFALGSASFKTEKDTYSPKEMVRMEIEILDEFGFPVQGDFSLAVTDGYQVVQLPNTTNIHNYFHLGNELRGEVEMPAYYFDPENENAVPHLDNLLLTQGWRRFSWDRLANLNEEPEYGIEDGLKVEGIVKTLASKEIKEPQQITMIINSFFEMPLVVEGLTDEKGNFQFDGLAFTDSVWVFAQAFTEKEKRSGEVKQLKYNEIELTQPKKPELSNRPILGYQRQDDWLGPDDYLVHVGQAHSMMEQFILGREIQLAEVTVQAKRQDKIPDKRAVLYGNAPESSVEVTREHYMYANVFQLIRGRFAGVNVVGDVFDFANPPRVLVRGGTISGPGSGNAPVVGAQIWIDGQPSTASLAITIPMTNIERVDMLKSLARSAMVGGPLVNILTRDGNPNRTFVDDPRFGMGNAVMLAKGFAPYREFYVPSLEYDSGAPIFRDYRSTIYWNPNIITGLDGKAYIEFPLTEGNPEINFVLEGLSVKKHPYFATYTMKVQ